MINDFLTKNTLAQLMQHLGSLRHQIGTVESTPPAPPAEQKKTVDLEESDEKTEKSSLVS